MSTAIAEIEPFESFKATIEAQDKVDVLEGLNGDFYRMISFLESILNRHRDGEN